MEVIHINDSNDVNKVETVRKYIDDGKDVYILVYMEGCGACDIVHPEWNKIKQELETQQANDLLQNPSVVIVDLNKDFLDKATFINHDSIIGFPTLLFLGKGKKDELNASLPDAKKIVAWIQKNSLNKQTAGKLAGGRRKTKTYYKKKGKLTKKRKSLKRVGGKWSLKYKKSIDCRNPRGFSQRQHCKYGRKK
jgi:hypothetical protein